MIVSHRVVLHGEYKIESLHLNTLLENLYLSCFKSSILRSPKSVLSATSHQLIYMKNQYRIKTPCHAFIETVILTGRAVCSNIFILGVEVIEVIRGT